MRNDGEVKLMAGEGAEGTIKQHERLKGRQLPREARDKTATSLAGVALKQLLCKERKRRAVALGAAKGGCARAGGDGQKRVGHWRGGRPAADGSGRT